MVISNALMNLFLAATFEVNLIEERIRFTIVQNTRVLIGLFQAVRKKVW